MRKIIEWFTRYTIKQRFWDIVQDTKVYKLFGYEVVYVFPKSPPKSMGAFEYLKSLPREWIPRQPSNSELFRWLKNGSVHINGVNPSPKDEVTFPVTSLSFFHDKNTVTMI